MQKLAAAELQDERNWINIVNLQRSDALLEIE